MLTQSPPPCVSVVIPVRNAKDYIQEAIDSVLNQGYEDVEILVIDDGSDDFDYQTLAQRDSRIRVVRLEGKGVSHARNTGMRLARGRYFAFLDADDVWFRGKLTAQVRYLDRHPEVGVVFGRFIRWTGNADGVFPSAASLSSDVSFVVDAEPERSGWLYTRLLLGLLVGMNTAVIRREVFDRIGGFDESMRIGEDYDFWLRASRIAEMHSLAAAVALYRIHAASAMHRMNVDNHLARLLENARARWGLENPDGSSITEHQFSSRLATTHFNHGYSHYWHGDPAVARSAFLKAFKGGVLRHKAFFYCILTSLPAIKSDRLLSLQRRRQSHASVPDPAAAIMPDKAGPPLWARAVSAALYRGTRQEKQHTLTIFTFHKVPAESEVRLPGEHTVRDFERLVTILQSNFNLLPLSEGVRRLRRGDLPRFAAAISFDDGYATWFAGAVPILERHAIPATFFISTCQLEGRPLWFERVYKIVNHTASDRSVLSEPFRAHGIALDAAVTESSAELVNLIKYLPTARRDALIASCEAFLGLRFDDPLFSAGDVKTLQAKGFDIGAHTVNHPILACCSDAEARLEVMGSKDMLQDVLRMPVDLFSYPNGVPGRDLKPAHVRLVQDAGFRAAVTTAMGAASPATPIFQLPRFDPWTNTRNRLLAQYLMNLHRKFPLIQEHGDVAMAGTLIAGHERR